MHHHLRRAGWCRLHTGVYLLTNSPPSQRQLWVAAALTGPGTVLSHRSAAACFGFHSFDAPYETVTRAGRRGRSRRDALLIYHSTTLAGNVTRHTGLRITTAPRTLIDIAPGLGDKRLAWAFRESIRMKTATTREVVETAHRNRGRTGTRRLLTLATRYSGLPYDRTKSNAEARGLEVLYDAGVPLPEVNVHVAGEEADFTWRDKRVLPTAPLIIEIDGPQFHLFAAEDERKQRIWEDAGYTVRRIPSDRVYDAPELLVAAATSPSRE